MKKGIKELNNIVTVDSKPKMNFEKHLEEQLKYEEFKKEWEDLELGKNLILEDEYDLDCYERAINEYEKEPKTYALAEVKEELGL